MEREVHTYNMSSEPPLMVEEKVPVLMSALPCVNKAPEMGAAQARMPQSPTVYYTQRSALSQV